MERQEDAIQMGTNHAYPRIGNNGSAGTNSDLETEPDMILHKSTEAAAAAASCGSSPDNKCRNEKLLLQKFSSSSDDNSMTNLLGPVALSTLAFASDSVAAAATLEDVTPENDAEFQSVPTPKTLGGVTCCKLPPIFNANTSDHDELPAAPELGASSLPWCNDALVSGKEAAEQRGVVDDCSYRSRAAKDVMIVARPPLQQLHSDAVMAVSSSSCSSSYSSACLLPRGSSDQGVGLGQDADKVKLSSGDLEDKGLGVLTDNRTYEGANASDTQAHLGQEGLIDSVRHPSINVEQGKDDEKMSEESSSPASDQVLTLPSSENALPQAQQPLSGYDEKREPASAKNKRTHPNTAIAAATKSHAKPQRRSSPRNQQQGPPVQQSDLPKPARRKELSKAAICEAAAAKAAQQVLQEAPNHPRPCQSHRPTLEELRKVSFSEYIRHVVLRAASKTFQQEIKAQNDREMQEVKKRRAADAKANRITLTAAATTTTTATTPQEELASTPSAELMVASTVPSAGESPEADGMHDETVLSENMSIGPSSIAINEATGGEPQTSNAADHHVQAEAETCGVAPQDVEPGIAMSADNTDRNDVEGETDGERRTSRYNLKRRKQKIFSDCVVERIGEGKRRQSPRKNSVDSSSHDGDDDSDEEILKLDPVTGAVIPPPMVQWTEGMAKVSLPYGFWSERGIASDRTARGTAWQAGRPLGDFVLKSPIQQHIRGMAGVYEYTLIDQGPITMAEFRKKADEYRTEQVGTPYETMEESKDGDAKMGDNVETNDDSLESKHEKETEEKERNVGDKEDKETSEDDGEPDDTVQKNDEDEDELSDDEPDNEYNKGYTVERIQALERLFWKRLGPTMPPALYGADQEGTFFGKESAMGWAVAQLDSVLHVLNRVPGVTSPYLYAGMWASAFAAHKEDMNLMSINYLHAGQPKFWYAIAPGIDSERFEALAGFNFAVQSRTCKEFLRHKQFLISPLKLQKAGIRYTTAVQFPGEAIVTFPGGYHFGFNAGFNIAEATNFAVPEWIPHGLRANVCLCRPDSVRIDMQKFMGLLRQFNMEKRAQKIKRRSRGSGGLQPVIKSWKEWSRRREEQLKRKRKQREKEDENGHVLVYLPPAESGGERDNETEPSKPWLVPQQALAGAKPSAQQRKNEFWVEVMQPVSASAAMSKNGKPTKKGGKASKKKGAKKCENTTSVNAGEVKPRQEIWHLAKPIGRKGVALGSRVLCILPAKVMSIAAQDNDEDASDEECFAGQVIEITDDHARVRLDGLSKADDVWLPVPCPKLYHDGGRWSEEVEEGAIPALHYWQEMDSKRRCVEKKL